MTTATAPNMLAKGYEYKLTVSGVELVGKVTSRQGHIYRLKVADGGAYAATRYHFLTFHIGQVTKAERIAEDYVSPDGDDLSD